jgi:ribosomal protein L32
MSSNSCLNCEATLDFTARFCPNCGQKTNTHRLTLSHLFHDFFHALTYADKRILYLLRALALKPGIVAREYIAGKKTYITMIRRSSEVTGFMNKHSNIPAMFAVPLFSFLSTTACLYQLFYPDGFLAARS